MITRVLLVLSSLVLISGCSRPLQRPERTFTVAPPKAWQSSETLPSGEEVDWWAYFGDRGLDNAVTRALTFNQDLRAAAARVSAAEAEARIAGAALRPSVDLGRLANEFEPQLPKTFRFLTRGLGTRQTKSPDFLSMVLFQPDYIDRLIELGEADAEGRADEIDSFIRAGAASAAPYEPDLTV